MRHEIMLPIELNTDAIEQKIEEDAYQDVTDWLKQTVMEKGVPKKGGWADPKTPDWKQFAEDMADEFFAEHKDELLEAASARIAERMAKTKAFKEAVAEAVK